LNKVEFLNSLGFTPTSENLSVNLEVMCRKGHIFKRAFGKFKEGSTKCPICEKEEKVKFLNDLGFITISKDLSTDLEVKCKKGHIFKRRFGDFKKGTVTCPICEKEEKIEFLNNLGFTPISEDLANNLEVKCEKGHTFKRAYKSFRQGITSCPICEKERGDKFLNNLYSTTSYSEYEKEERIKFLNGLGFTPISKDLNMNLEVKCEKEHIFKRRFSDFKKGTTKCPHCEIEEKLNFLDSLGFTPISENLAINLEVKCKKGHIFKRAYGNFKKGATSCPICEREERIKFLNSLGFTPISEDLNNNLEVRCKNGHTFKRLFDNFKNGSDKCPECEREEKIRFLNSLGFTPISEDLIRNVEVKCKKGHTFKRIYTNFKNGITSCPECEKEEKIKILNGLGLTPISEDLIYNLELKCKKGHTFKRAFSHIKQGIVSCPICEKEEKLKLLNDLGFIPISEDLNMELEVKCEKGHTFKRAFGSFKRGNTNCPICEREEKIEFLNGLSFTPISEDLSRNLEVKCEKGHIFKREFSDFKKGATKCPICFPNNSSAEVEIKEFLNNLGIEYIYSDWSTIAPQELDFYVPSHNLAIEFNGIYWHSELQGKGKDYHLEKTEKCSKKNINLLHIFENEWTNPIKQNIWKSIIKGKLGLHERVYARKCILKQVSKPEEKQFLEENHLQGYIGSQVAFGLYHNDELLCLMSFGKNRFASDVEWELLRFVSKQNINVVGGASKLLKHFMSNFEGGIVSYADRRYSTGDMYKALGFQFSHFSQPNYFYFKISTSYLESRQKYMKHKLPTLLETFNPSLTEWENMANNGYNRIWDCGNSVWKAI
jgi:uncharacterized Zn finger protein (UPF0148 family)